MEYSRNSGNITQAGKKPVNSLIGALLKRAQFIPIEQTRVNKSYYFQAI
jgi:hypothetical protein